MKRAVILGTGSCLPERTMTNFDLEKIVDTSDEWITTRTGIKSRRIAGAGEETSKIAAKAARRALKSAGLTAKDIDLILVATMSAEMTMPSCACLVQKELGARHAFAYDLNAACSGFLFGLDMADKYIMADPTMKILLIGSENLSSRINWQDRNTCILFGDGAGACVVGSAEDESRGLIGSKLYSDGRLWELLSMNGAPSMNPFLGTPEEDREFDFGLLGRQRPSSGSFINMAGRDVFKHAVKAMENSVTSLLKQENLTIDQIKLVIPHQANIRILNNLTERLGLAEEKVYINVFKYGNTSAASIPIALDEANSEGRLQKGDLLLFCAFGGGFTWGSLAMRW